MKYENRSTTALAEMFQINTQAKEAEKRDIKRASELYRQITDLSQRLASMAVSHE